MGFSDRNSIDELNKNSELIKNENTNIFPTEISTVRDNIQS